MIEIKAEDIVAVALQVDRLIKTVTSIIFVLSRMGCINKEDALLIADGNREALEERFGGG